MTLQGKSCEEIVRLTGFGKNLVYQYRYKLNKEIKAGEEAAQEEFSPGHNADRKKCQTCCYRGRDPKNKNGCDYIEHEGHSRGCSVEDCNRYVKGPRLDLKNTMSLQED